jgi:hypothetical protein
MTPSLVVVAELDGQPGRDIAVAYEEATDHVSLIPGGVPLGSRLDVSVPSCTAVGLSAGRFTPGDNQALILTCQDRVQFLQSTGGGGFTTGLSWPVAPLTQKVAGAPVLADVDGDGDLDVVLLRQGSTGTLPAELWWFENLDGNGTLAPHQLSGNIAISPIVFVDTADLNNDGKPDVLISDRQSNSPAPLTVLLNVSR